MTRSAHTAASAAGPAASTPLTAGGPADPHTPTGLKPSADPYAVAAPKAPVGRINKLFGTGGGLMLSLYADFPDDFTPDRPLFVTIDGLEVPLYCDRFERRGAAGAVATFADLDTERRAQELIGLEFRMPLADAERDDDEFFLEDLIGFAVSGIETRAEGDALPFAGRVADYYDSESNPLFELEIDGRNVLIPAAEEFFAHIDFDGRRLRLVLPEGLIHL